MRSFNAKVTVLSLLSVICGIAAWCSFVLPQSQLSTRNVVFVPPKAAPDKLPETKTEFVPFQMQVLPWHQAFLTDKGKAVRGFAMGYYLQQKEIDGVSVALMHAANQRKSGLSISAIDFCGESSGLSMFLAGGAVNNKGCAVAFWNLAETNNGVQIGLLNKSHPDALVEYGMKPQKKEDGFGVQAGLVNYSEGKGVQFGLWNTNPNGFLKHFPIINISW